MLKFTSYFSGSRGNVYTLEDGQTAILIEAGVSYSEMLKALPMPPTSYSACLISHLHKDHSLSSAELSKRGVDVYIGEKAHGVTIGTFRVSAFPLVHDVPCYGFRILSTVDMKSCIFLTDTASSPFYFPDVDILAIEANFSKEMIGKNCVRRDRVFTSHLSLEMAMEIMKKSNMKNCREVHLLHMSTSECESCGEMHANAEIFVRTIQNEFGVRTYAAPSRKRTG